MKEFWHEWGDKVILVSLILFFTSVATIGYWFRNADMSSFSSDLAKQLVSALLTLLVAASRLLPKTGTSQNTTEANTPIGLTPETKNSLYLGNK